MGSFKGNELSSSQVQPVDTEQGNNSAPGGSVNLPPGGGIGPGPIDDQPDTAMDEEEEVETVGGFNDIDPVITQGVGDQTVQIGLTGNLSGTRGVQDLEVHANPGAGEEFQTMTLRCTFTPNNRRGIDIGCNNAAFTNGVATFDIEQDEAECVSGDVEVEYWVEDADPNALAGSVPERESARRTFTVSIENTCYSEDKIYPNNMVAQNNFGTRVKMDDRFMVMTVPLESTSADQSGAVDIYRNEIGGWNHIQTIKTSDPQANDRINAISLSGDYLAIGSPESNGRRGAAFVYRFNGSQFIEERAFTPPASTYGNEKFGTSVAVDSSGTLVVGAPDTTHTLDVEGQTVDRFANGALFVYRRSGGNWPATPNQVLRGENPFEQLGTSVVINSDYIVGGASANFLGQLGPGRLYLYNSAGVFQRNLAPGDGIDNQSDFAESMDLDGDHLVVGSKGGRRGGGGNPRSGNVHYYNLSDSDPIGSRIIPPDGSNNNEFGYGVAIDFPHVVVGARYQGSDGNRHGAAYHYKWETRQINDEDTTRFFHQYKMKARDRTDRDYFGSGVAVYGNQAVVGSPLDDGPETDASDTVVGAGAIYLFGLE